MTGYGDVSEAERLARDPSMRAIVGRQSMYRSAASSSQMGRFETEWLATDANLDALPALSGTWVDRVHKRRPPDGIILDMDSSESSTHGEQEGSAWNGHFRCTCYDLLFVFNRFSDHAYGHYPLIDQRGDAPSKHADADIAILAAIQARRGCSRTSEPAVAARAGILLPAAVDC
jgi:Transposase DDE domain group 1